jgi:hypothetical protein
MSKLTHEVILPQGTGSGKHKCNAATAASQNGFCTYKLSLHRKIKITQNGKKTVVRIRDVYLDPNFSIPDPNFFHPGSASKNLSILTQRIVSKLSEI